MLEGRAKGLAGVRVPHPRGGVLGGGDDAATVGTEDRG